jgi:hypothetical protein
VRRALPALLCLPLLLGACTADGPSEPDVPERSDFRAGTCRTAAPDLITLGRTLPRLGDDGTVAQDVQTVLRDVQDQLVAVSAAAEPEYAAPIQELVETIGGVRLRAVGNTYEPALGDDLRSSYDRLVEACTAGQ